MRSFWIFFAFALSMGLSASSVGAQNEPAPVAELDPLDLSRFQVVKPGEEFPTVEKVASLEKEANDLFSSGDCETALPKIISYYSAANQLSNVIRRGVQPYYDASYDDKENADFSRDINELAAAETASNSLVKKRNIAWVMEAECLVKLGRQDEALASLFRALDYISVDGDERVLWRKARKMLWDLVAYTAK